MCTTNIEQQTHNFIRLPEINTAHYLMRRAYQLNRTEQLIAINLYRLV
jgi:hypothetical protein